MLVDDQGGRPAATGVREVQEFLLGQAEEGRGMITISINGVEVTMPATARMNTCSGFGYPHGTCPIEDFHHPGDIEIDARKATLALG